MPEEGQLTNRADLESLVRDEFPSSVCHAFGYGSGVFVQQDEKERKMIDLILVTDDSARSFHEDLLKRHDLHYSLASRLGGPSFCAHVQNAYGAKVFFHAFVDVGGLLIKYGIVEKQHILDDLNHWKYLYLAGRMHKPTLSLIKDDQVSEAQSLFNLPRALATSLLLLNDDKAQLPVVYESIAQLSYSGDPRMDVGGEDPDKVKKLVHGNKGQLERFKQLYQPTLDDFSKRGLLSVSNNDMVEWDVSALQRVLPSRMMAADVDLRNFLRTTVRQAARAQSIKGIVTAGVAKSAQYALAKLSKGLLR